MSDKKKSDKIRRIVMTVSGVSASGVAVGFFKYYFQSSSIHLCIDHRQKKNWSGNSYQYVPAGLYHRIFLLVSGMAFPRRRTLPPSGDADHRHHDHVSGGRFLFYRKYGGIRL